jgi:hypothetical protein
MSLRKKMSMTMRTMRILQGLNGRGRPQLSFLLRKPHRKWTPIALVSKTVKVERVQKGIQTRYLGRLNKMSKFGQLLEPGKFLYSLANLIIYPLNNRNK